MIPDDAYVMDELVAVHSYGAPGVTTSSPDGGYVYTAEGGTVALLRGDPTLPNAQANYETPIWRIPVGDLGATPIEMILDPGMSWTEPLNATDPFSYLLIAGGRDGLWIMDASPVGYSQLSGGTHHAYRVDDSGNTNPATQNGLKWCNDVKVVHLGAKAYVLALFAGRGRSNLRVYDLDLVRAVAAGGLETGNEIAALRTVFLKSNPNVTAPTANPAAESYSFGMAVDSISSSQAHVYVAMGEHGIFRVLLKELGGFLQPPGAVEHGPWFGDGSPYLQYGLSGGGQQLYGSLEYYLPNNSTSASDFVARHNPFVLDVAVQNRGVGEHRLYAAVDTLGWCAFSLEPGVAWDEDIYTPSPASAHGYPDFIQEGKRYKIGPQTNDQIRLYDDPAAAADKRQTHARHIDVVETVDDATGIAFSSLVVSVSRSRFSVDPLRMNDGRSLTASLNLGPIDLDAYPEESFGKGDYILAYDLRGVGAQPGWAYDGQNLVAATPGGWELYVPEDPADGELHVLYGADADWGRVYEPGVGSSSGQNLVRAMFDPWPPTAQAPVGHSGFVTRGRHFRLGRSLLSVGPSKVNPRVLVTSHNDGGVVGDGPLIFDPTLGTIEAPFASHAGWVLEQTPITVLSNVGIPSGQNNDLGYGVTMDPRGGFVGSFGGVNHEYRMGFANRNLQYPTEASPMIRTRWYANKFTVTESQTQTIISVVVDKEIWLTPPACKFSVWPYETQDQAGREWWSGRPYYNVMSTFEDYNAYVVANYNLEVDTQGLMFAGVNGSPQGIWALRLSTFQGALDAGTSPINQDLLSPRDYGPSGNAVGLIQGTLVTHPEYWNVDDVRTGSAASEAEYFIQKTAEHSLAAVQTWYPDVFEMPVDGTPEADTGWLLAVPAGYIAMDPQDPIFTTQPSWVPDTEFANGFGHMMVRLFDVTDPSLIAEVDVGGGPGPNEDSPNLPAVTIIGPDDGTAAYLVRHVSMVDFAGVDRELLLVGDLSGRVYLYDIADVFQTMAGVVPPKGEHFGWFHNGSPLTTYTNQLSLSDGATNGVYGMEVRQENWMVGQNPMEATYVYLGTPRVGIEVIELRFNSSNVPEMNYLGRIQTPGDASLLYAADVDGTEHLFVADYAGGIRIYRHPSTGQ